MAEWWDSAAHALPWAAMQLSVPIVERHRLTIPADREVAPAPNLTLTPRGGLRMRVEPRD